MHVGEDTRKTHILPRLQNEHGVHLFFTSARMRNIDILGCTYVAGQHFSELVLATTDHQLHTRVVGPAARSSTAFFTRRGISHGT